MQDNKTHHKKSDKVIRPHIPGWSDDERRIHRIRRRIRQTPRWLWVLTVVVLMATTFVGGWSWSGGRSSVLAEQLTSSRSQVEEISAELTAATAMLSTSESERTALAGMVTELESQLSAAPTTEQVEAIQLRLDEANARIIELDEVIKGWAGRVDELTAQVELQKQSIATQAALVTSQTNRANRLQTAEAERVSALPGQIATQLNSSPPIELAEYRIAVSQEILRESFGIRFGSINDETLAVTVGGTAAFGPSEQATATGNEISIGLPKLIVAGLTGFTADSYTYEAGFLARVGDQDVSDLMVWVETNQLQPKACADVTAMRGLISQTERRIQSAAGGQEVEVVWVNSAGREFDSSQLTNAILLSEASLSEAC